MFIIKENCANVDGMTLMTVSVDIKGAATITIVAEDSDGNFATEQSVCNENNCSVSSI